MFSIHGKNFNGDIMQRGRDPDPNYSLIVFVFSERTYFFTQRTSYVLLYVVYGFTERGRGGPKDKSAKPDRCRRPKDSATTSTDGLCTRRLSQNGFFFFAIQEYSEIFKRNLNVHDYSLVPFTSSRITKCSVYRLRTNRRDALQI